MPPSPASDLMDELVGEILLRLPPDEPEHLFRAALVCKPWLRVLCDSAFRRRYRAFHGAAPLLGLLHRLQVDSDPRCFAPTTAVPLSPCPDYSIPVDCRHGRVLLHGAGDMGWHFVVWDPVTGDRHRVPRAPDIPWMMYTAAVLCAAGGCNHLDCHGGPFRVIFGATNMDGVIASVYSSETGAWSAPASLDNGCQVYARHMRDALAVRHNYYSPWVEPRRCTLIGDAVYFTIQLGNTIVKYNWPNNCLSMINPPSHKAYNIALMVMEDSTLGFACIERSCLFLWSRKVNSEGAAEWVQREAIELETIVPVPNSWDESSVAGFAEGLDVIFLSSDVGLFTIQLKSRKVKKLAEPKEYFSILPYMSFFTPDRGRFSSLARLTDV